MKNTREPVIIGAVHLPYYGRNNPFQSYEELEEYALVNVRAFADNGINTVYIQDENLNSGSAYPETIALLSSLGRLLKAEIKNLKLGFIMQAHDGIAPIAVAAVTGADFVRIKVFAGNMYKAEGMRTGVGVEAVNYRTMLQSNVKIFADVYDREGIPVRGIPLDMAIGWADHIGADGFILTGHSYKSTLEYLEIADKMDLKKPVLVGGSVTEDNIYEILDRCDGAVISSSLMLENALDDSCLLWDVEKIKRFSEKVRNYTK